MYSTCRLSSVIFFVVVFISKTNTLPRPIICLHPLQRKDNCVINKVEEIKCMSNIRVLNSDNEKAATTKMEKANATRRISIDRSRVDRTRQKEPTYYR